VTGPIVAAFILTLIPADLILLGTDPNLGQVIQGTLLVLVVMVGGLASLLQRRRVSAG
jgi:ribose transport system permease protein